MHNPNKTKAVRRLGHIDVSSLRDAVLAIPPETWAAENEAKPNRFNALDRTQHIVFRFVDSVQDWRKSYDRPLWAEWRSLLEPVLNQVTAEYGYRQGAYPRIMLARMAPGGIIKPHVDMGPAARWPHKIHIPLQTNDKVSFYIQPHHYHFAEGEAVEVNNLTVHAVRNDGDCARIHLIFEYCDLSK